MCGWSFLWNNMHRRIGGVTSDLLTTVPIRILTVALTGTVGLALVAQATDRAFAQQGPRSATCTAYMSGNVVGTYNCLAGTDQSDSVNFIQWEDGTASTGLGGWRRSGKNCFAASEQPSWKICRD
jgi:hypothetical protein